MEEMLNLVNEMSPYLLLGFLIAGLMHVFIPGQIYSRYLSGHSFRSVVYAALFGIPLPLCSCGVLPTAMSLRKEGASKGAVVSFLIATPETGVDSVVATYSLLGLPFAIIRPIAALFNAVFAGVLVNVGDKKDNDCQAVEEMEEPHSCCCCHEEKKEEEHSCCCHEHEEKEEHSCCCHEHEEKHEHSCCCHEEKKEEEHSCCCHEHEEKEESCCCCHEHNHEHKGFFGKIGEALEYAFVEMMGDIGKWLVIGLVIAGLITVFVPDSLFEVFRDNSLMSMLLVLCIAVPMYICATGSIPIAVALMLKGLTPGAALVLLMAGPACNMASILIINKVLGRRSLAIYLFSIFACAIGWGLFVDWVLPTEWFTTALQSIDCCHEEETSWFNSACSVVLALLLLNALYRHFAHPHECSCHNH